MAIYTQYGRYLKAKLFKKEISEDNDLYMGLGLGNPDWDESANMTIASYDTISSYTSNPVSQFYDGTNNQLFTRSADSISLATYGDYDGSSWAPGGSGPSGYADECKYLNPLFPCSFYNSETANDTILESPTTITKSTLNDYWIQEENTIPVTYSLYTHNGMVDSIDFPTDSIKKQYFTEMYLRGLGIQLGGYHPVGLLGFVKCTVDFVKDIGTSESNSYTGESNQFWYGDRYWEIVHPDNDHITGSGPDEFPHHLLVSAIINPRQLCSSLVIDRNIVPRHIALYTKAHNVSNPLQYRAGEWIFNFGQYAESSSSGNPPVQLISSLSLELQSKVLNFTLPCTAGTEVYPNGEFKFLLHDYIRGSIRDEHSVERIGYIIGF